MRRALAVAGVFALGCAVGWYATAGRQSAPRPPHAGDRVGDVADQVTVNQPVMRRLTVARVVYEDGSSADYEPIRRNPETNDVELPDDWWVITVGRRVYVCRPNR
jgi:hypothetical protein